MCKAKSEGSRCPITPQRKEVESYRQKVKYRSKKEGLSSSQWLQTEDGKRFELERDPRLTNPLWLQEHRDSMKKLQGQVTNSESLFWDFSKPRGDNQLALSSMEEYSELVSEGNRDFKLCEKSALVDYSHNLYRTINDYLRKGSGSLDKDTETRILNKIKHLDSMLSQRRGKSDILFRCIGSQDTIQASMGKYLPGAIVTFNGYTSTSHSPVVALDFSAQSIKYNFSGQVIGNTETQEVYYEHDYSSPSNHSIMFELKTNAGQAVSNFSQADYEREVLLPRGMKYKVLNTFCASQGKSYKVVHPDGLILDEQYRDIKSYGVITEKLVIVQLAECNDKGEIVLDARSPYYPKND